MKRAEAKPNITHGAGSEQGGQDYGLIPGNVTADLSNGAGHPTFDAYVSTSPAKWEASNTHFCCTAWSMGCKTKRMHGVFDPLAVDANSPTPHTVTVHGWAWSEAAAKVHIHPRPLFTPALGGQTRHAVHTLCVPPCAFSCVAPANPWLRSVDF